MKGDQPFARGKRGELFLRRIPAGEGGREEVVLIKRRHPRSPVDTIGQEAFFTALANQLGIGPRLRSYDGEELVRELVRGLELRQWLPRVSGTAALRVFRSVLRQCRQLDLLGVSKLEMTRPWKHVIIRERVAGGKGSGRERGGRVEEEAVLIDFERCRWSRTPQNVTQFCQFLSGKGVAAALREKGVTLPSGGLRELAREYKRVMREELEGECEELFSRMDRLLQLAMRGKRGGASPEAGGSGVWD